MNFSFTEEQILIRDSVRDFLQEHSASAKIRKAMESEYGYDPLVWDGIARQMGWTALRIPEAYGGLDMGFVEQAIVLEEMGNALLSSPYYATVCLAANAIQLAGSEEQKQRYLPRLAAGDLTATLAFSERNGRWDADGITAQYKKHTGGFTLRGTKRYVLDGHSADLLIVAARQENSNGCAGISLLLLEPDCPGVERKLLPVMDLTRRQAELSFNDAAINHEQLLGEAGQAWPVLEKVLQLAALGLAAEQLGGARRCLDMTVNYSKERVQFGRPIGSFQAVKHKCADMMVKVESARSAVYYAACIADEDSDELKEAAAIAKAYCSETYMHCAADAIQLHGGIGFTWEYDLHLYFKRARCMEHYLGSPDYQRGIIADHIISGTQI